MKVLSYKIMLREEPEGGYTVLIPSLPGVLPMETPSKKR